MLKFFFDGLKKEKCPIIRFLNEHMTATGYNNDKDAALNTYWSTSYSMHNGRDKNNTW